MLKQPEISINFKQKVLTFVTRSARSNVILIIKDDTDKTFTQKSYSTVEDLKVDEVLYTEENLNYIKDVLYQNVYKCTVIRVDGEKTFEDGLKLAEGLKTGWIGFADGLAADYEALFTWTKDMAAKKCTFMALGFKPTTQPNSEYCHCLINDKVVLDNGTEVTTDKIIPILLGVCATANVEHGLTYAIIPVKSVIPVADVDTELGKGNLVLINDEGKVKIALGINSLTTLTTDQTEDFKFIEVMETINLIKDDIGKEFKIWIGKHKNTTDNQMLFVSAVRDYFKMLAEEDIFDKNFTNKVEINIEAQRVAWIERDPEAATWNDKKVLSMAFGRKVFLKGNIKILQSMTDLQFDITF